jgi:hypothetical protein
MRAPVRTYEKIGELKTDITSAGLATGARAPEDEVSSTMFLPEGVIFKSHLTMQYFKR